MRNIKAQNKKQIANKQPGIFFKGIYLSLENKQRDVFKKIYWIRDKYAQQLDWAPNNLMANGNIRKLVTAECNINELSFNKKIPDKILSKFISEIESIV